MPWIEPRALCAGMAALALVVGLDCAAAGETAGPDLPAVDAVFADWDQPGSPGCALAIADQGQIVYSRGYGHANLDHAIPVTPQTVFDVASVTKQFVAALLHEMAGEGRLSLDDHLRRWLPELPDHGPPLSLRHLLLHTSGLRDYLTLFPLAGRHDYYPISHDRIRAMMARQQALSFPPGERFEYSNTAYMLLAQVLERASGQSLGVLAQERIFEPLGMARSRMYDDREAVIPGRATGYARGEGGDWRRVHNDNFDVAGDGQLYSTVEDLLIWEAHLHAPAGPDYAARMRVEGRLADGEPTGYGQGLRLEEYRGLRTVGHSGSSWGFRTELVRFVEPGLSIAVACNADQAEPGRLAERVADHYLAGRLGPVAESPGEPDSEQSPTPGSAPALTQAELAPYAGAYVSPELDVAYHLEAAADGLLVRIGGEGPIPARPLAADAFGFDFHPPGWSGPEAVRLDFTRESGGGIEGFRLAAGSVSDIRFIRRRPASPAPGPAATVIVGARVLDGSGGPARQVSVRIAGERIATVGAFEPVAGEARIDAHGLVLAPGFVDTHSHHDDGLHVMPAALGAVSQGITTIVAGQDGGQPYPLAEFFSRLEAQPVALNVASFAGHGTLREQVMGEDYRRPATPEEIERMAELLRAELRAGALGLSSGLEYDPGSFSTTAELVALARVAAAHGGRYTSHIRSEDRYFWEAVEEAITIGREADIPVRITHIKLAMSRWWGQAGRLEQLLDQARADGVDVTADIYPYRAWNTGFAWLATVFPERDLDRREGARYILEDMLAPETILLSSYLPEPALSGRTLAEIAALRGTDPATTLIELLRTELEGGEEGAGSQLLAFAMDEPDIEALMAWPHTVIASDGELAGVHPRGFGSFPRFLGHYVRERGVLSLAEGVRRISALPAAQAGLAERGLIEPGRYADLVLFDPERIVDRASPAAPHRVSEGVEKVWVNGEVVYAAGRVTGARPGRVLRSSPP